MAKTWVENTATVPRFIGGKLCQPGEGNYVDNGPLAVLETRKVAHRLTVTPDQLAALTTYQGDGVTVYCGGLPYFWNGSAYASSVSGAVILSGATAGQDSGWQPLTGGAFRLAYALDSGSTTTTFSVDISADGVTSLGQAFTGTWASSSQWEDTQRREVSNVTAKFFRFNVLSGGPLSVIRF